MEADLIEDMKQNTAEAPAQQPSEEAERAREVAAAGIFLHAPWQQRRPISREDPSGPLDGQRRRARRPKNHR